MKNERNAGRKPLPEDERKVRVQITLSPEILEKLKKVENRSGLIEKLLHNHFGELL